MLTLNSHYNVDTSHLGVLDRNTLFEKKIYKISLETKLMSKIVRNAAIHGIIKLSNVVVN